MSVSAQISIYPLRRKHLGPVIEIVRTVMKEHWLEPETGRVSTLVSGEVDVVFSTLRDAFVREGANAQAVMAIPVSNSCLG